MATSHNTYLRLTLLITVWLVLAVNQTALGQLDTLIYDRFNGNDHGWTLDPNSSFGASIKSGALRINNTTGAGKVISLKRFLMEEGDFVLQAEFLVASADSALSKGYGLVWGHSRDSGMDNYFLVAPTGYFIVKSDDKKADKTAAWRKSPLSPPTSQSTILRLEQRQKKLTFFINGHKVYESGYMQWFEQNVGIISYTHGQLLVDNFLLLAPRDPLTTLPLPVVEKENLGSMINSKYEEIKPLISADGKTLYFGRKLSPDNVGGKTDRQDIWVSTSSDGKKWSAARNIGSPINSRDADNLCAVSSDNSKMLFFMDLADGSFTFGTRTRSGASWSELQPLGMELTNESDYLESCLSPDGNAIFFTAKTKSNIRYQRDVDERDIYVVVKEKKGWSKPINLGTTINTPGDEYSPFLAPDGETLYFATDGRPGYGDVDIFMARRVGPGWTSWTIPVNMGASINTADFDGYYSTPASGEYAYLVSCHKSLGKSDIVRIRIPEALRPRPVVIIRGYIRESGTGKGLSASISFRDQNTGAIITSTHSDALTGQYAALVPAQAVYEQAVVVPGYFSLDNSARIGPYMSFTEITRDFDFQRIGGDKPFVLQNVLFEKGSPVLLPSAFPELDKLVALMREKPTLEIELTGHTDNVGSRASLITLSENRVLTVRNYLISNGILPSRIKGKGYGCDKPLVNNDSEDNRRQNRRVEFRITKI